MIHAQPDGPESLRPVLEPRAIPARNAAAQRRAMQAAMSNAVRALRTPGARSGGAAPAQRGTPPAGGV